jgi:hypothetical protein
MKGSLVQLPLRRTWRQQIDRLLLHFHTTSTMMPCAPPAIAPSLVLRKFWETLAWLASWRSEPLDFDACPHTILICSSVFWRKPTNLLPSFWGPNEETVIVILRSKSSSHRPLFWGPDQEIVAVVLRSNHWQTITTIFEARMGNLCFSSPPCIRCGSHTASPGLPIIRSPSTRLVSDHGCDTPSVTVVATVIEQ